MPKNFDSDNPDQDGEVVGDIQSPGGSNKKTDEFFNLESLIKRYVNTINDLRVKLREQKQMMEDAFENDAVYREHAEKVKEANRIKSATKQQIAKQPSMQELQQKIKDLSFDIKENEVLLSDYLQQYQKASGVSQIELEDGEILEIVNVAKLVRRHAKNLS